MQHHPPEATAAAPTPEDMLRVWRADHCIQDNTAAVYQQWIRRFRSYCTQQGLDERAELTLEGASRFIAWYVQHRHLDPHRLGPARTALYALSRVYLVRGFARQLGRPRSLPHRRHRHFYRSMPSTLSASGAILRQALPRSWPMPPSWRPISPGATRPGAR